MVRSPPHDEKLLKTVRMGRAIFWLSKVFPLPETDFLEVLDEGVKIYGAYELARHHGR